MKKTILLCLFCFVLMGVVAQDSYIKGRLSFQAGLSRDKREVLYSSEGHEEYINYYTVSGNYGVCNWLETGLYLGYHSFRSTTQMGSGPFSFGRTYDKPAISYGLKAKVHVFPWFIKKSDFRFDLYVPANLGAIYYHTVPNPLFAPERGSEMHMGVGLGAAVYLTKHIGLYAEYVYTRTFTNIDHPYNKLLKSRIFFGVSLKF